VTGWGDAALEDSLLRLTAATGEADLDWRGECECELVCSGTGEAGAVRPSRRSDEDDEDAFVGV
jgi:hypothetical protein